MAAISKQFKPLIVGHPDPHLGGRAYLRLTGEPPANSSERLVQKIMGEQESVTLHWLQEKVSAALYHNELSRGAGILDIGIWGPGLFAGDAARVLAGMRSEFASIVREGC